MSITVLTMGGSNVTPTPPSPDYEQIINYTMLYDAGDECEEITGGWTSNGFSYTGLTIAAATKNANNIYSLGATNKINMLGTTNLIDLSEYTKVWQYGEAVGTYTSDNLVLSILNNKNMAHGIVYELTSWDTAGEIAVKSLDIKGGNYYVAVYSAGDANRSGKTYAVFSTKSDDINTLCSKAGLSAPTSLDTLISDTTSLTAIFNNEDAVKFMVKQCTGDFMVGVLNNANAVALLKASPYLNKVIANPHWAKFMMMIPTAKELLNVTMLYDEGDECDDITGGWSQGTKALGDNLGTVTFNTDSVRCYCTGSGYKDDARMSTDSPITLNGEYNKLWGVFRNITITGNNTAANGAMIHMSVSKTRSAAEYGDTKLLTSLPTLDDVLYCGNPSTVADGYYTNPLDLSALSGDYYVNIGMYRGADTSGTGQFDISNAFFTKSDDWETWATIAGVTATDLATLLADSTKMATLMANEEACKYLMGCTGDLMVSICNSEVAMNALVNNIAYDYVFNHPVWYRFMTMIPTALEAMKSVAISIPTMTSNTAPSGVASASVYDSGYEAYKAFDKDESTPWYRSGTTTASERTLQYEFESPLELFAIEHLIYYYSQSTGFAGTQAGTIQASEDGLDWVDVASFSHVAKASFEKQYIALANPIKAKYIRLVFTSMYTYEDKYITSCVELQAYGKAVN